MSFLLKMETILKKSMTRERKWKKAMKLIMLKSKSMRKSLKRLKQIKYNNVHSWSIFNSIINAIKFW